MSPAKKYPIEDLVLDERMQARAALDQSVVDEYAGAYRAKADMPPVDVYIVDGRKLVVDGWHRIAGARLADGAKAFVRATVVGTGTIDQAIWHALAANRTHGLRRTNADKRRAVRLALESQIGAEQSSRVIADHVGVGDDLVSRIRAEWEAERNPRFPAENATQAPGDVSENDTSPPRRRDSLGRMQPAHKPKRPRRDVSENDTSRVDPPARDYPCEEDVTLPHEPVGVALPGYGPVLIAAMKEVARARAAVAKIDLPHSYAQSVASALRSVEANLRYGVPEVCPRCSGAKCLHCRERGWVEKSEGDQLRASVKAMAR